MNGQAEQDLFVYFATGRKWLGNFLEIGSNHPITHNNTYLLESEFKWSGIMVEYLPDFLPLYKQLRPESIHIISDARTVDYRKILDDNEFPTSMDYLQIDLDVNNRSTLDTLELLDKTVFDKYKFATITFEHDVYTGNYFDTREKSREIFLQRGYVLLFPDVSLLWEGKICQFEDWYVHPDLVKPAVLALKTEESLKYTEIIDLMKNI